MADLESILEEKRVFKPSTEFSKKANWNKAEAKAMRELGEKSPQRFWAKMAKENLTWMKPWKKVLEWKAPDAKWFVGGKLNVSHNCLDRHIEGEGSWRKNKAAIIWEGEPGDTRTITYGQLHREVCKFSNVLKTTGVKKGDRVVLYMPMIPELAVAMLACTRIGAIHSIIFGGFSANSISDRVNDAGAKIIITADGGFRRGKPFGLKSIVNEALKKAPGVKRVIVAKRTAQRVSMKKGRDLWWDDLMSEASANCPPAVMDAEDPLFILYTSGTTGKPKGILHTTGGYLTQATTTAKYVFDLKDDDIYWCTADIGWVTGHSYVVYGILANGATTVMYEGAPNSPAEDRFWDIIERHRVTIFYTAPTAIRTFIRWGDEHIKKHDLSSLRLLGTVGEPINPEAWTWYHKVIGGGRCPIVDTWWQTETGGIMISPLPGAVNTKPGSATLPFPGIHAETVNEAGENVSGKTGGLLVVKKPWPGMLRGIWGDKKRFRETYWNQYKKQGFYMAGDGAHRDRQGYFWIMGRIDDVMNVSGHRIGTMEVESALVSHTKVAEAAVVGRPDPITGTAVVAFVTLKGGHEGDNSLRDSLRKHVAKEIGSFAKPADIRFSNALPKTRSGKIMRRLLRNIAEGVDVVGDTTTLEDASIIEKLQRGKNS